MIPPALPSRRIGRLRRRPLWLRIAAWTLVAAILSRMALDGAALAAMEAGHAPHADPSVDWASFAAEAGHECSHCVPECFEGHGHKCMAAEAAPSEFGLAQFVPICAGASGSEERLIPDHSLAKFIVLAPAVAAGEPPPAPPASAPQAPRSFHSCIDTPPPEA